MVEISGNYVGSDRIAVPLVRYLSSAGQLLRTHTYGFDGRTIVADHRYDTLGRLRETTQPHYTGEYFPFVETPG